jgi:hypothetical protein
LKSEGDGEGERVSGALFKKEARVVIRQGNAEAAPAISSHLPDTVSAKQPGLHGTISLALNATLR